MNNIANNDEANARLIAAAPDMLEAVKFFIKATSDSNPSARFSPLMNAFYMRMVEAVRKAEGK